MSSPGGFAGPLSAPPCTHLCLPVAKPASYPPPTWGHFILSLALQASHSSGSWPALGKQGSSHGSHLTSHKSHEAPSERGIRVQGSAVGGQCQLGMGLYLQKRHQWQKPGSTSQFWTLHHMLARLCLESPRSNVFPMGFTLGFCHLSRPQSSSEHLTFTLHVHGEAKHRRKGLETLRVFVVVVVMDTWQTYSSLRRPG